MLILRLLLTLLGLWEGRLHDANKWIQDQTATSIDLTK